MNVAIASIGHNMPPGPIEAGTDTMLALSDWMKECPVIETDEQATEAKKLLDRAKNSAAEIEDARTTLVAPLNEQVEDINARHKAVHNKDAKKPGTLDLVARELKLRLTRFIEAEEARRKAELQRATEEAERIAEAARQADAAKQEAIANAKAGELGVDVTQVVVEASNTAKALEKAARVVARADRATHVKVAGGWGNSVSLRTAEVLVLESYGKAIKAIGPNDKIRDAILSASRDYRREHGHLPDGVKAEYERKL